MSPDSRSPLAHPARLLAGVALVQAAIHLAVDGRTIAPLVWLHTFTDWFGLVALAALALGVLARDRWTAGLSAVLAALHGAWLLDGVGRAAPVQHDGPRLVLTTANLLSSNPSPEALLDELRAIDPDVLLVQEVSPGWANRLGAEERWPHRHLVARPDNFGIGVLSKHPFEVRELDLVVPALDLRLDVDGQELRVLNVHTVPPMDGTLTRWWAQQLGRLENQPPLTDGPLVVAGDLNLPRHTPPFSDLQAAGYRDAFFERGSGWTTTWGPAGLPILGLDHVLVAGPVDVASATTGTGAGSDHRPVTVELALPTAGQNEVSTVSSPRWITMVPLSDW